MQRRSTQQRKQRGVNLTGTSNKRLNPYSRRHSKSAYRSGLEETNAAYLKAAGIDPVYECYCIHYTIPPRGTRYTPDFLLPNGIIVETKGRFVPEDRMKHTLIKEQHPELDIRFVFTNSNAKLYKGSPTSYAQWCTKFGFKYADRRIPDDWLKELPDEGKLKRTMTLLERKEVKTKKNG